MLARRTDYEGAVREFRWPALTEFHWALDWFDVFAQGNQQPALILVDGEGVKTQVTFAELSQRSSRVANWLSAHGVRKGDRIQVMLGNVLPLWETMLAAIKLGAVVASSAALGLFAGLEFGVKLLVGGSAAGWTPFDEARSGEAAFGPSAPTLAEMRGNMSLARCPDPSAFSRANYMRILQSWRV